jgi:acetyl-CoA C-acetyltransferase
MTVAGSDPLLMLTGPIPVIREVLQRSGLSIDDIDRFEVNEAFASVVLAWAKELDAPLARNNVNGGAIALGHPLGATEARLITSLVHELRPPPLATDCRRCVKAAAWPTRSPSKPYEQLRSISPVRPG